jgi:hypothetical protein
VHVCARPQGAGVETLRGVGARSAERARGPACGRRRAAAERTAPAGCALRAALLAEHAAAGRTAAALKPRPTAAVVLP